ncbi:hypothetical protein TBLA_0F03120 [Henningerozyma blattae CBS 6284]|uniref:Transcription factor IIIC subunit 5 HTH domain-containing protein n=1 Tax=Henningerozyma blattae (strain ATCC 34711 / CBS 6284 / DSM 70876 / NBRC 10599 / NRRL Y-10934 / UCD 77-7) TaxID=1071380 RepID=I2H649_HENB6|nr:hypothetical protein TBLA_0F03120 [Tetrapisispora blattae CBS 6284]CCH61851.1 hypothetical protein TBLA_0F03120 [Tetrapisispora blattae CBS 6284]
MSDQIDPSFIMALIDTPSNIPDATTNNLNSNLEENSSSTNNNTEGTSSTNSSKEELANIDSNSSSANDGITKNPRTKSLSTIQIAREYTLDIPHIPSIEFPLNIKNNKKSIRTAINMCGGIEKINSVLNSHHHSNNNKSSNINDSNLNSNSHNNNSNTNTNELELHLNNKFKFFNEHPIVGKNVPFKDDSILIKLSVPKGSMAKYNHNIPEMLSNLSENEYKILPVGIVDRSIKFREMSDFQYNLSNCPTSNEFLNSFGNLNWQNFKTLINSVPNNDKYPFENISNLPIDNSNKGDINLPSFDYQLAPPPKFSMVNFPLLYNYKGNPLATKKSNGITEVKGTYIKNYQLFVHALNMETPVPFEPSEYLLQDFNKAELTGVYPGTKKESNFYQNLKECLKVLDELFEKRPIWVKRHIDGIVPKEIHHTLKIALALVSYRFTLGPWRNTYIKFGIDPRTSSKYAQYQTEYFKIERKLLNMKTIKKNLPTPPPLIFESNQKGYIDDRFKFNGKQIPWYLMLQIDLLLDEENINEIYSNIQFLDSFNEITGWFNELDLTKIRRIVKYELGCLVQGNHNFNQYKLKYFKTMLYPKESMIKEAKEREEKQKQESESIQRNESEMFDGELNKSNSLDKDGDYPMNDTDEDMVNTLKTIEESRETDSTNSADKNATDTVGTETTSSTNSKDYVDAEDYDEDNGVATGEPDEEVLQDEEDENDDQIKIDIINAQHDDEDEDDTNDEEDFDVNNANFQDIIDRISKLDPQVAMRLHNNLNGLINGQNLVDS